MLRSLYSASMHLVPGSIRRSPSLSALSDLAAAEMARVRELARALSIMDIEHVDPQVLPFLAWQLRADVWLPASSEEERRAQVLRALRVWRYRGTLYAVETALEQLKVSALITEWWQRTPTDTPHTFEILAFAQDNPIHDPDGEAPFLGQALQELVLRTVDLVKPVRSQYSLLLGARFGRGSGPTGILRRPAAVRSAHLLGSRADRVISGTRRSAPAVILRHPASVSAAHLRGATSMAVSGAHRGAAVQVLRRPVVIRSIHLRSAA